MVARKVDEIMKAGGSLFIAVFFLFLGFFGLIQSLFFRYWESMVLPLSISCCLVVLAGIQIIREIRRDQRKVGIKEPSLPHITDVNINLRWLGLIVTWTAAFAISIFVLGFYIAIPIFTFAYLKWHRRSWVTAIVFASTTLAVVHTVFVLLLKVSLFPGLIFGGQF